MTKDNISNIKDLIDFENFKYCFLRLIHILTYFLQFQTMRLLMARLNLLNSGVVVNLVAPLKDLTIEGKDEKTAANVVGM